MSEAFSNRLARSSFLHVLVLLVACLVVYSNNFEHDYHLDSAYTLLENPAVRDLSNIPRYFVDPSTYTVLREQVDYRPVLQVSYAINYWMSEYSTWWWHLTQIFLHAAVTVGLYFFGRRFAEISNAGGLEARSTIAVFLAALVFAVHPAASGVVNYLNARSSLLTAMFLVPAIVLYMDRIEKPNYARPAWGTAVLYTLALFTKVEAVGVLGVLLAYEVWQRERERAGEGRFFGALARALDSRTLRRTWPVLTITLLYAGIRLYLMDPYDFADARHAANVGAPQYLLTQLTAWWYYLLRWVAPVSLVADYASYPVFHSIARPEVLLALAGWIAVGITLIAHWDRVPHVGFLAIAALALLAPTSSVSPLAEMVNEHRPYLAIGLLWVGLSVPLGRAVGAGSAWFKAKWVYGVAIALAVLALSLLTVQRNRTFATGLSYWGDVIAKAPSARAYLNYGLEMLRENEPDEAERYFVRSLEMAPNWYIAHINMGLLMARRGDVERAAWHFDRAVETDLYSGLARTYRAEFHLEQGRYEKALQDLQAVEGVYLDRYRFTKDLATAYAGLGEPSRSARLVFELLSFDEERTRSEIPMISAPFFRDPELHRAGITFYDTLSTRLEGEWWIHENLARLALLVGDSARATSAHARAAELGAPASETNDATTSSSLDAQVDTLPSAAEGALMQEGIDLLYSRDDPAAAAERFREVLRRNPTHYGAHYQLAVTLERLNHGAEARMIWEEVLRMAERYQDQETAATARSRLSDEP